MCHPSRRDNLLTLVVLCPHLEREIKHFDYTLCKVTSLTQGSTLQEMADDRCISKTFHRQTLNILNRYLLLTLHFHKTKVQLLVCCATSAQQIQTKLIIRTLMFLIRTVYVESKVKSEIRELSSNSNNIMGNKLCLQLCGFLKFLARIQDVLFTKTNNLGTNKEINV